MSQGSDFIPIPAQQQYPVGSDAGFQGKHSLYPSLHMLLSFHFFLCIFFMNSVSKLKSFRLSFWKSHLAIRMSELPRSNCQCAQECCSDPLCGGPGCGHREQLEIPPNMALLELQVPTGFQIFCSTTLIFLKFWI